MQKSLLPFFLLLFLSFNLQAKPLLEEIPGEIHYSYHIKQVTFLIPVYALSGKPKYKKLHHQIKFLDETGKRQILYPSQAREVRLNFYGSDIRFLTVKNSDVFRGMAFSQDYMHIFLKLEVQGKVNLLSYYYDDYNAATGGGTIHNYILHIDDYHIEFVEPLRFKMQMNRFFSDCPKLLNMIVNRTYRYRDMKQVVIFYNQHCGI
jgi:hypothetical protein